MEGKSIESLEGSFKFLTFEEAEEFVIEDAPKAAKRPLTDARLKAAGVKLLSSKGPFGDALTLSCGKGFFLGQGNGVIPDDANGAKQLFSTEIEKNLPVQKLQSVAYGGKFPDNLQIQFKVFRQIKEQTATFKFANVALPSPESKPKFPGADGAQPPIGLPKP